MLKKRHIGLYVHCIHISAFNLFSTLLLQYKHYLYFKYFSLYCMASNTPTSLETLKINACSSCE